MMFKRIVLTLSIVAFLIAGCEPSDTVQAKTKDAAKSGKNYFPIRIERSYDSPGGKVPGGENYEILTWRNEVVNNYDFAPNLKGREEFLKEVTQRRAELAKRAAKLKAAGVKPMLHEYEIQHRGAKADLSTPEKRLKFLEDKVYEIMKLCPWLDGYVMTTSEAAVGAETPQDVKDFVLAAYKGLDRANKEDGQKRVLMIRSWLSNARIKKIKEYFPITDDEEIARNIYIITKHQHSDFHMRIPINPLIGNVGGHPQIIAFDITASEYRGFSWYPCGLAHEWSERFKQLAKIPTVVGLHPHTPKSLNEFKSEVGYFKERKPYYPWFGSSVKWTPWAHLNYYTFHTLANDPFKDPRQIYIDWATKVYGVDSAEAMADILTISSDVVLAALGPNHSGYLPSRPSFVWSSLEYHAPIGDKGINPFVGKFVYDTTEDMVEEKQKGFDEVLPKADKMIAILDSNKSGFAPDDYQRIRNDLIGLKSYLEVKYITDMGTHRYFYWQNLKGQQRKQQVDIVAGLVKRGFEIYDSPQDFLFKNADPNHSQYKRAGNPSYIHCVRELDAVVEAERKGVHVRVLPEKVEEAFNLPFKPKEITCVDNNLYILGEKKIYQYSTSGKEIGSSKELTGNITALGNDNQGNLLLVIDRDICKLSVSDLANAKPVKWHRIPDYIKKPGALAYDSQSDRLFIGDNKDFRIVQIDPNGKEQADILVPYHCQTYNWDRMRQIRGFDFYKGYLYSVESYIEPPHRAITRGVYKLKQYAPVKAVNIKAEECNEIEFIFAEHLDAITNVSSPQKEFCYQAADKPYHAKDDLWGIHPGDGQERPASLVSSVENAPKIKITIPVSKQGEYELYLKTAYSTKYSLDGKNWDSCNGEKSIGLVKVEKDAFELYIDGDTADNKNGCYIVSAELKTPMPKLRHTDDWQLAMQYSMKRDVDHSEDVCFDSKGNAWFIRPSYIFHNDPRVDMLYRVKLQGGVNYKPKDVK